MCHGKHQYEGKFFWFRKFDFAVLLFEEQAVAAFISGSTIILGDVNRDGAVNFLDISPFIAALSSVGEFREEADINEDGMVNFLDISPFITLLTAGDG